jgi:hypothetical protein
MTRREKTWLGVLAGLVLVLLIYALTGGTF